MRSRFFVLTEAVLPLYKVYPFPCFNTLLFMATDFNVAPSDVFSSVAAEAQGLYKEKGSRFLSFVYPVASPEAVKPLVDGLRRTYHDARHVCYAYRLAPDGAVFRSNDDGEPSGTAGRPMLGCLLSHNLVNVLVVVVRYFGGVKLGVSGLAQAYKLATEDALSQSSVISCTVDVSFFFVFDYLHLNEVMKVVKDLQPKVLSQQFEVACSMSLSIRQSQSEVLHARLLKVPSLKFSDVDK